MHANPPETLSLLPRPLKQKKLHSKPVFEMTQEGTNVLQIKKKQSVNGISEAPEPRSSKNSFDGSSQRLSLTDHDSPTRKGRVRRTVGSGLLQKTKYWADGPWVQLETNVIKEADGDLQI